MDGTGGQPGDGAAPPQRKRRVMRRVVAAVVVFVLLLAAGVAGLLFERQSSLNGNIERLPNALPTGNRPEAGVVGSENWLLVGSDSRADEATTGGGGRVWKTGQQRSDTLMLMHLPADRRHAYVISFPRDSWVEVRGYGNQKINAAFSYGGPSLLIETVEDLTGIRIDHFAAIDFAGFKSMTDALGGVEVTIAKSVYDPARKVNWHAGVNKLDGDKALLFVRQRYNLPGGDFDRIKRQQAFLRALASKAASSGTLTNPLKLNRFLEAFTKSISLDDTADAGRLRALALSLRGLRVGDVSFLTVPHRGSAARGKQSVVLLDPIKAKGLFEAIRADEVATYVDKAGGTNKVGTVS